MLSASDDGTVKLWQLPLVPPRPLVHPDLVTSVALSPDGHSAVSGSLDGTARLWSVPAGAARAILGGHLGEGAAISSAMIPFLLGAILISWFGLQRRKWQQGESND